jgi:small-conductance mechanosensitive channel
MKTAGLIASFLALALLLTARFGASGLIVAALHPPYGARLVSALGVMAAVGAAILLDRLVRAFYWDGYLHRRLKRETPAVVKGLLTIALIALGASVGLFFEEGVSFAGVLTASGAAAFVLGIALQAPINDVFSGVSLNLDDAFAIGDWLTIYSDQFPEPIYGRVQGVTWRTTFLRLSDGRRLLIPNHALTSNPVMNHSRPPGAKRLFVEIPVAFNFSVDRAMSILLGEAFRTVRSKPLVAYREPDILVDRVTSDAIIFHVRFYAELEEADPNLARSIMMQALYRAMLRHNVPNPVTQVEMVKGFDASGDPKEEVREALRNVSIFQNILATAQLDALAAGCELRHFSAGTVFIKQGEPGSSMFLLLEGAARVSVSVEGIVRDVAVLTGGDIVGEMSLMTGAPRTASVTSLSLMRVLEVTKASIEPLLAAEPGLLERVSHVLATRQSNLSEIASSASQKQALQSDILAQMRRFFARAFH